MLQFTDYIRVYVVTCVLAKEAVGIACKVILSDTIEDNRQVHGTVNTTLSHQLKLHFIYLSLKNVIYFVFTDCD